MIMRSLGFERNQKDSVSGTVLAKINFTGPVFCTNSLIPQKTDGSYSVILNILLLNLS